MDRRSCVQACGLLVRVFAGVLAGLFATSFATVLATGFATVFAPCNYHVIGAREYGTRIGVRDQTCGVFKSSPATGRDALFSLWFGACVLGAHEIEMTHLVHQLSPKAKEPVDGFNRTIELQFSQAGFFLHFAHRCFVGQLTRLEMSLGKTPVVITVANKQE